MYWYSNMQYRYAEYSTCEIQYIEMCQKNWKPPMLNDFPNDVHLQGQPWRSTSIQPGKIVFDKKDTALKFWSNSLKGFQSSDLFTGSLIKVKCYVLRSIGCCVEAILNTQLLHLTNNLETWCLTLNVNIIFNILQRLRDGLIITILMEC